MNVLDVLIFGAHGPVRNYYELEFLRRHLEIATCSSVAEAVTVIEHNLIKLLALVGPSIDTAKAELLKLVQLRQALIPVFFLPEQLPDPFAEATPPSEDSALKIIPELVNLLTVAGVRAELDPNSSHARQKRSVAIRRSEYSLNHAEAIAAFEVEWLTEVLKRSRGNISRAAREMGMARRSLQLRIRAYEVNMKLIRSEFEDS